MVASWLAWLANIIMSNGESPIPETKGAKLDYGEQSLCAAEVVASCTCSCYIHFLIACVLKSLGINAISLSAAKVLIQFVLIVNTS